MSAIKFSEAYLRNLKPRPGQRYEVTDALTTGLKARVSPGGTITFVLKARGANSKVTTITLGKYPDPHLKRREHGRQKTVLPSKMERTSMRPNAACVNLSS